MSTYNLFTSCVTNAILFFVHLRFQLNIFGYLFRRIIPSSMLSLTIGARSISCIMKCGQLFLGFILLRKMIMALICNFKKKLIKTWVKIVRKTLTDTLVCFKVLCTYLGITIFGLVDIIFFISN